MIVFYPCIILFQRIENGQVFIGHNLNLKVVPKEKLLRWGDSDSIFTGIVQIYYKHSMENIVIRKKNY